MTRLITAPRIAATARAAAFALQEQGWYQGDYTDATTCSDGPQPGPRRLCILAAIAQAVGAHPDAWTANPITTNDHDLHALMRQTAIAVGAYVGVFGPDEDPTESEIAERLGDAWNDTQHRTAGHVIRALRGAADTVEIVA